MNSYTTGKQGSVCIESNPPSLCNSGSGRDLFLFPPGEFCGSLIFTPLPYTPVHSNDINTTASDNTTTHSAHTPISSWLEDSHWATHRQPPFCTSEERRVPSPKRRLSSLRSIESDPPSLFWLRDARQPLGASTLPDELLQQGYNACNKAQERYWHYLESTAFEYSKTHMVLSTVSFAASFATHCWSLLWRSVIAQSSKAEGRSPTTGL